MKAKNSLGFTLIELIATITILGIIMLFPTILFLLVLAVIICIAYKVFKNIRDMKFIKKK